jgi:hypothetical protein
MDHAEATRTGATERYLLGELSDDDRLAYEEHFFECLECAEDVKAGATFVVNTREVLNEPSGRPASVRFPRRGWAGLFLPLPAGVAAALVLCAGLLAYQSLVVVPRLHRQAAEADAPQAVRSVFLTISRSDAQVVTVSPRDRRVELRLSGKADRAYPQYRVDVQDAKGTVVLTTVAPVPPPEEELQVLLPVHRLSPGAYVVVLAGLDPTGGRIVAPDLARYPFTLQRREE